MATVAYTCSGYEPAGDVELFDKDGVFLTSILASRCFANWWSITNGWTWAWRDGVDPEDPATWP